MVYTGTYRGRRITVHPAETEPKGEYVAFVDGWPVSDRRRGMVNTFPSKEQAIGRCRVLIDEEAPARRIYKLRKAFRRIRYDLRKLLTGEGRAKP